VLRHQLQLWPSVYYVVSAAINAKVEAWTLEADAKAMATKNGLEVPGGRSLASWTTSLVCCSGIVVVDGVQMQVAGMPAYTDLTKAHEVANLARRLQKELRDAINDAAKYNNRERLFDMIITNVCIVCSTALCLRFTRCFMMTTMTTTTTTNLPYGDFPEVY